MSMKEDTQAMPDWKTYKLDMKNLPIKNTNLSFAVSCFKVNPLFKGHKGFCQKSLTQIVNKLFICQVDVMIHVIGGESNFVTFTGVGYEESVMGPTMNLADQNDGTLPKKQLIPVEEQVLNL